MSNAAVQANAIVVEWAPFRVKPGVDDQTLLERSAQLQEDFLRHQPGFVRRELLKGKDDEWVDLVYWADEESAHAIMSAVADSPVCHAYFALMVGAETMDAGAGVSHFRQIRTYG
jgi:hypothetical protein